MAEDRKIAKPPPPIHRRAGDGSTTTDGQAAILALIWYRSLLVGYEAGKDSSFLSLGKILIHWCVRSLWQRGRRERS